MTLVHMKLPMKSLDVWIRTADTGFMSYIQNSPDRSSSDSVFGSRLRAGLRERRETRAARRALEAELASYTSDADVNDLLALLSHHDSEEAEQMRSILTGNLAHRSRSSA